MRLFEKILPQQKLDHELSTRWLEAISHAHTQCNHPCAVVLIQNVYKVQYSNKSTGQIEDLENKLFIQNADGIIFYSAQIQTDEQTHDVFVAQLLEQGHTRWIWYAPCRNIKRWWIEPHNIENLLIWRPKT